MSYNRAQIQKGELVLVQGAGPIGLAALKFAKLAGAHIIALDVNPYVPNDSSATFDFGAQTVAPAEGCGSMQVYNHDAQQTLFALNHWRDGKGANLGIGNASTGNPDWTFATNAGNFKSKRLRIFMRWKYI